MEKARPTVPELANGLLDVFPKLDDTKRRVALSTYRRLARGVPASLGEIAADVGGQIEEVRRILGDWIGVYTDEEKRVIGFWGLAIPKMKHRFELDGARLHAWCAWDALFLPELLGRTARVESACAMSGQSVRLTVSPAGVESADPASLFVSFVAPESSRFEEDIINRFCHYVHFFRSRDEGEAWIAKTPGTFLLTLDEAVELARLKNHAQFGALLRSTTDRGQRIVSEDRHPMKPEITLVYDADCPNVRAARAALREALELAKLEPGWIEYEYDRAAPGIPERLLRFGSPTILVDGEDVADEPAVAAAVSCRVYQAAGELRGVPPVEAIVAAINRRRGAASGTREMP